MNVLIINAFGKNEKEKFDKFIHNIKTVFKKCTEKFGADPPNYIIRQYDDLDDYLFSSEAIGMNPLSNQNNQKNFDKLDFVFLDGYEKYLPWKKHGLKFQILLKMCKDTKKALFAAGVGLQILIYLLATNFNTDMNLINSNQEIKLIEDVNSIPKNFLPNLGKKDYFLDYATGDIYEYILETTQWVPIMNIGLHNSKIAENNIYRGKYVINNTFRPKSVSTTYNVISSNHSEIKTNILKYYSSHWIFKDLYSEFLVFCTSTWFSHNFSLKSKYLQYSILSDSNKGPMMVEYKNCIAVCFHINDKYPDSMKILENFVYKKFKDINEKGSALDKLSKLSSANTTSATVINVETKNNDPFNNNPQVERFLKKTKTDLNRENFSSAKNNMITEPVSPKDNRLPFSERVEYSSPFSKIKRVKHEGTHVGVGFSRREMIFVENNAVNTRPVSSNKTNLNLQINRPGSPLKTSQSFGFYLKNSQNQLKLNNNKENLTYKNTSPISNGMKSIFSKNKKTADYIKNTFKHKTKNTKFMNHDKYLKIYNDEEMTNYVDEEKGIIESKMIEYFLKKRRELTGQLIEISNTKVGGNNKLSEIENLKSHSASAFKLTNKSRTESAYKSDKNFYRKVEINDKENLTNNEFKSIDKESNNNQDIMNTFNMMFPYVRQEEFPKEIERHVLWTGFDNVKKGKKIVRVELFKKSSNDYNKKFKKQLTEPNKDSLPISIPIEYEKITEDQRLRRDYLESKKKWVDKKDFKRVFSELHSNNNIISGIDNGSPLRSPSANKFREVDRTKWVSKKNFKV